MSEESKTAGDTSALAPTLRERLKDGAAPITPVTLKPAAKSKAIPAWMRRVAGGSAVGKDGVVENPTDAQRSMQNRLSGMFPRGPGV